MRRTEIAPNPGPQTDCLASGADIVLYGGAAGGGKTFALLLGALAGVTVPGYSACIFRREAASADKTGGLFDQARRFYYPLKARENKTNKTWRFPGIGDGGISFAHLQHTSDVFNHQGAEYAFIGFDELTHFEESQFWYMISRLRTGCGEPTRMICTLNPDPDSWVFGLVRWWIGADGLPIADRAGRVRWFVRDPNSNELLWFDKPAKVGDMKAMSLTFIPALAADNPMLDPEYMSKLSVQDEQTRVRLKYGMWSRSEDRQVFKQIEARGRSAQPVPNGVTVLCLDASRGIRHATGIVIYRTTADGPRVRAEVVYSAHYRGRLLQIPPHIQELCGRYGVDHITTDTSSPATNEALELIGPKVHVIRGTEDLLYRWSRDAASMLEGGALRIPTGNESLEDDLSKVMLGTKANTIHLPEYTARDGGISHCDAADALIRGLTIAAEVGNVSETVVRVHGTERKSRPLIGRGSW